MPCAKPPIDLTVDDHRIDQLAAVFDDHIVENLDIADFGIDRDQRGMGGIAERAGVRCWLVADGGLETARIDIVRQILRLAGTRSGRSRGA